MSRSRSTTLGGALLAVVMALVAVGVSRLGGAMPVAAAPAPSAVSPAPTGAATPAGPRGDTALAPLQPAIRAVAPAVVTISTASLSPADFFGNQRVDRGAGSGVIIDPRGFVLTNAHVVGASPPEMRRAPAGQRLEVGVDRVDVGLPDGSLHQGQVIAVDVLTDLAVVKILGEGTFPAAALGDADALQVGEWVIAIGQPFEFPQTVTVGIVSALAREELLGRPLIQTDAAINQGNSGGPLINLRGEVVGVNEMIVSPSGGFAGLSFAIPVNAQTKQLIATMLAGRPVERGYLGAESRPVGEAARKVYGVSGGSMVVSVAPDGPAAAAGLRALDLIVSADGTPVRTPSDVTRALERTAPGQTIRLGLVRRTDGGFQTLEREVRVGSGSVAMVRAPEPSRLPGPLGIDARELPAEWRAPVGEGNERIGVGVYEVDPLGVGGLAGLRRTDFILAVNGQYVRNLDEYNRLVARLRAGDAVVLFVRRWNNLRIGGQWRDIVIEVPAVGAAAGRS